MYFLTLAVSAMLATNSAKRTTSANAEQARLRAEAAHSWSLQAARKSEANLLTDLASGIAVDRLHMAEALDSLRRLPFDGRSSQNWKIQEIEAQPPLQHSANHYNE
jgi:hypothetical protein